MCVHSGIINEEIGFHTIGNSTSLSALGSIFFLKDFFLGTMSGGMEVVFLVEHSG